MKVLQINATLNTGSTGRIAEGIGRELISLGHESHIAYGRYRNSSKSIKFRIGSRLEVYTHKLKTLLTDRHGFGSEVGTEKLLQYIKELHPDAIGLHNLHGYYIHIGVLFKYLGAINVPIVWTLFDCWAFTGHCTYYDSVNCEKWKTMCHHCPKTHKYPASFGLDQSTKNYRDKKRLFHLPENLHLVVHSKWLESQVKQSFLQDLPIHHIYNGTDLTIFKPKTTAKEKIVLGVANIWDERKGLKDIITLRKILPNDYKIIIIGLKKRQIKELPLGFEGIERTENREELAGWYSRASVFINPTYQDNFPTTNIEALACGTPVITYNTGGSPEAIDAATGIVVEQGDIQGLFKAIKDLDSLDQQTLSLACRERAERMFNQEERYCEYVELYKSLVNEHAVMNP